MTFGNLISAVKRAIPMRVFAVCYVSAFYHRHPVLRRMTMFPCCGYDPGFAAYLAAIEDFDHQHTVGDE